MKIFIICSKAFYDQVTPIKEELESKGNVITLPNCFDNPEEETEFKDLGCVEHSKWKKEMFRESEDNVQKNDAVLILNFEKNGIKNYLGGAAFLEMYDAFKLSKKIFMYNEIPEGMLYDEIVGFSPIILNEDLNLIN